MDNNKNRNQVIMVRIGALVYGVYGVYNSINIKDHVLHITKTTCGLC